MTSTILPLTSHVWRVRRPSYIKFEQSTSCMTGDFTIMSMGFGNHLKLCSPIYAINKKYSITLILFFRTASLATLTKVQTRPGKLKRFLVFGRSFPQMCHSWPTALNRKRLPRGYCCKISRIISHFITARKYVDAGYCEMSKHKINSWICITYKYIL